MTRGVCGVPGGPYALLLPRSKDFNDLFLILKARRESLHAPARPAGAGASEPSSLAVPRSLDRISLIGLFQLLWDRSA